MDKIFQIGVLHNVIKLRNEWQVELVETGLCKPLFHQSAFNRFRPTAQLNDIGVRHACMVSGFAKLKG